MFVRCRQCLGLLQNVYQSTFMSAKCIQPQHKSRLMYIILNRIHQHERRNITYEYVTTGSVFRGTRMSKIVRSQIKPPYTTASISSSSTISDMTNIESTADTSTSSDNTALKGVTKKRRLRPRELRKRSNVQKNTKYGNSIASSTIDATIDTTDSHRKHHEMRWYKNFLAYQRFVEQSKKLQQEVVLHGATDTNGTHSTATDTNVDTGTSTSSSSSVNGTLLRTTKSISVRNILPKKDKKLRVWIVRMRREYQKKLNGRSSILTDEREKLLRDNGFLFFTGSIVVSWDTRYEQLVEFLKKYNGLYPHEIMDSLNDEEMDLYHWCNRQRILRKAYVKAGSKKKNNTTTSYYHINDERIRRLDDLNFVWSIQVLQWHERYMELQQYYNHHGNCMVPPSYVSNPSLGRWVETQRRKYVLLKQNKKTSLTEDRIKLLNEMGFEWDGYEVKWIGRYNDLIKYQELHGEKTFPSHKADRSLYRWIVSQRNMYHQWLNGKPTKMNENRRDRLEALGMDWTIKEPTKKISRKVQLID